MAAYTIVLTGAAGVTAVTPKFDFSSGTIAVDVDSLFVKNLTSGVEDNISLSEGETLEYICSDWDAIIKINISGDKVLGDISGWTLPSSLTFLNIFTTSVSGDISGWTLPSGLKDFYVNSASVSGDISGWTLPSSLVFFYVYNTSVSGDISGWTLPSSLAYFSVYTTSVVYDSSSGAFEGVTDSLVKIDFDNCTLAWENVDNVLADLVTSGIADKTLDIGDDNSGPSLDGWANKLILETRGWTVKINATVQSRLSKAFATDAKVQGRLSKALTLDGALTDRAAVIFTLHRPQENWYMRVVRPLDSYVYDADAGVVAEAPSWANSIVVLTWNTATSGYPITVPVLPDGNYDLLFYNAASPAAVDEVLYGREYKYQKIWTRV